MTIRIVCLLLVLCVVGQTYALAPVPTCPKHNPANPFMADVSSSFISAVQAFLPEGKPVATALLSQTTFDPNFFFDFTDSPGFTEAYINVTILWEGAGYRNQFGYFTYTLDSKGKAKVLKEVILYNDVSFPNTGEDYASNPACLQPGVSTTFGPFKQGDRVGWFCYPNRVRSSSLPPLYSIVELNTGAAAGEVHVFVASLQGKYIVGVEDVSPLKNADRDYNDIVFMASTIKAGKITVPEIPADCKTPLCNGRGVCNKTTLACDCATTSSSSYYSGDACEIITPCNPTCGAGICTKSGCVCDTTRYTVGCQSCAAGRYVFPTCDPCPSNCKQGCNVDGTCYVPPPPPPPTPPPTCLTKPFLDASDYAVFVSGAFTGSNSDIQTRLAAGGAISLTQYSVGEVLALTDDFNCNSFASTDNKNTLVAGGSITFPSGNVRVGNIVYGTTQALGASVTGSLAVGCVAAQGNVLDFSTTFTWLTGLSRTFNKYSSNGNAYVDPSNKDRLIFQAPTKAPANNNYVWSVSGSALTAAKFVSFVDVPTTAAILIVNVATSNGKFAFTDASFESVISSGLASRLIWNFNNARSINIQSVGIAGTILAPFAAVTGSDSVISGRIYASSFSGSTQVNADLDGPSPCILSNIKIEIDDGSCPACLDGAVAGTGCKCSCTSLNACVSPFVADPSGACQCVCNANPNCPLGVDANCNCKVATAPVNTGSCQSSPFGLLSDYQISTLLTHTTSSAYIGGRCASGGALSHTRVNLGNDLLSTPTDDCSVSGKSVLCGGQASIVSSVVTGNIIYGGASQFSYTIAIPAYPRNAHCEFPEYNNGAFAAGGQYSISDAYANTVAPLAATLANTDIFPTTGVYVMSNDIMTLYGANVNVEVFAISATDLANTRRVDVRGLSSASTIIINVAGSVSVKISKVGLSALNPFARLLIWNAPTATSFSFTNVALPGFILAPNAVVSNPVGQLLGGAIVKSWSAKGNVYVPWLGSFAGCIPTDVSAKACGACAVGSYRQDTSCTCYPVVSISAVVTNDFGFNTGYSVKYTINNKHSKPLSSVTVQFPASAACPIQVGTDGTNQVFSLNAVAGAALQYSTPSWTGFSADSYSFIALYYNAAGTCNAAQPLAPTLVSVSFA